MRALMLCVRARAHSGWLFLKVSTQTQEFETISDLFGGHLSLLCGSDLKQGCRLVRPFRLFLSVLTPSAPASLPLAIAYSVVVVHGLEGPASWLRSYCPCTPVLPHALRTPCRMRPRLIRPGGVKAQAQLAGVGCRATRLAKNSIPRSPGASPGLGGWQPHRPTP